MTVRPDPTRVVVLADGDVRQPLHDALHGLGCEVTVADDLFDGVAKVEAAEADAVVVDLTSSRDDPRALAHWVRDNGIDTTVVGLVDPVAGVADGDLDDICDELVLTPPTIDSLAAALDLALPDSGDGPPRLTVKIHAALLERDHPAPPPEAAITDDGAKPGLIVGLGSHAEAPRYDRD